MSEGPVLICYDGSDDSKQAVTRAAELFPGRAALVLHVWEPLNEVAAVPPIPGLYGVLEEGLAEMDRLGDEVSERLAQEGAEAANAAGLDAQPLSVSARGRAWRNILKTAGEHNAQVIVVGKRGIGAAERVLLGSVSAAVVNHADLPVLVVP